MSFSQDVAPCGLLLFHYGHGVEVVHEDESEEIMTDLELAGFARGGADDDIGDESRCNAVSHVERENAERNAEKSGDAFSHIVIIQIPETFHHADTYIHEDRGRCSSWDHECYRCHCEDKEK